MKRHSWHLHLIRIKDMVVNEPFSTFVWVVTFQASGILPLALMLLAAYKDVEAYLGYVNGSYLATSLFVFVYMMWYWHRFSKNREQGLRSRFQYLRFTMSALSWSFVALSVLLAFPVLALIPSIQQTMHGLFIPMFVTVTQDVLAAMMFGGLFQEEGLTTAVEALTQFDQIISGSEKAEYRARLQRQIWSFLLYRVERAFRTETHVRKINFSGSFNIVALALGFGNEAEVTSARKWLEILGSRIYPRAQPADLIAHVEAVSSEFPRLSELHSKYDLSYDIKTWSTTRFLRTIVVSDRIISLVIDGATFIGIAILVVKFFLNWP